MIGPVCFMRMTPGLVDDVGFGHAVDAVVDADAAVEVEHRQLVGIAVLVEPGVGALEASFFSSSAAILLDVESAVAAHFLVVEADERDVALLRRIRRAPGAPARQETHHDAQTLSSQTLPSMSLGRKVLSGAASRGSAKAGAGLPTSGDGTRAGRG